jgi:hypothetical protein
VGEREITAKPHLPWSLFHHLPFAESGMRNVYENPTGMLFLTAVTASCLSFNVETIPVIDAVTMSFAQSQDYLNG